MFGLVLNKPINKAITNEKKTKNYDALRVRTFSIPGDNGSKSD